MSLPRSRDEFKSRILRDLGAPVITVNVDESQVEDAINDAYSFWSDYHFDGSRKEYIVRRLTATDITNKWVPVDPSIIAVTRLFKLNGNLGGYSTDVLFNVNYQVRLSLWDLSSNNLTGYVIARQYLSLIDDVLNLDPMIRFNEYEGKLFIDMQSGLLQEGACIVIECHRRIDPKENPRVWEDRTLRKLAAAYLKKTWGVNLTKFNNVVLPGGLTMNGEKIYNDAVADIERLEEDFIHKYQAPDLWMIG